MQCARIREEEPHKMLLNAFAILFPVFFFSSLFFRDEKKKNETKRWFECDADGIIIFE